MLRNAIATGLFFASFTPALAAYECPRAPQQVAEDVVTEAHGSATSLVSATSSSYDNVARKVTTDLIQKYPNSDRLLVRYTVLSMACQVIMGSNSLSDDEKLDRLYRFDDWVTHGSNASTPVRSDQTASCTTAEPAVLKPVRALFSAWENLDVNSYLQQWGPDAIQRSQYGVIGKSELAQRRKGDFTKYSEVDVLSYAPKITFADGRKAVVNNRYSMRYVRRNGQSFTENESENYTLECLDGRWVIRENNDYLPPWSGG
jgi:hypothetical protein